MWNDDTSVGRNGCGIDHRQCGHQEITAFVGETAQCNNSHGHGRCERERTLKNLCPVDIERWLIQESRDVLASSYRNGAPTRRISCRVCELKRQDCR